MASVGMKAQIKKELRDKGIREVRNAAGRMVKLQNAKTSDLVSALSSSKQHLLLLFDTVFLDVFH